MNAALVALFLSSSCVSVLAPTLVVATLAIVIFIGGTGGTLSISTTVLVISTVAAIPVAAFLASRLIRPLLEGASERGRSSAELLAVVLVTALVFRDGGVLVAATEVAAAAGLVSVGALVLVFSRIVLSAAVVALVISGIVVLSESVVLWGARAARVRYPVSQAALRQIVVLLAVAAALDLIIAFFGAQLAPLTLAKGVLP